MYESCQETPVSRFSALQRAEIAEIYFRERDGRTAESVSVLFNEPKLLKSLERNERPIILYVSVLFNEPKLLKSIRAPVVKRRKQRFSALQRAEIAEILTASPKRETSSAFQCSSTSRNC